MTKNWNPQCVESNLAEQLKNLAGNSFINCLSTDIIRLILIELLGLQLSIEVGAFCMGAPKFGWPKGWWRMVVRMAHFC
jgi:hypothetical protein